MRARPLPARAADVTLAARSEESDGTPQVSRWAGLR